MKCQVIFIGVKYWPDAETLNQLRILQDVLCSSLKELAYQYRLASDTDYFIAIHCYHYGFRSRLKLIHSPEIKLEPDLKAV